eukprot:3124395-Pyramimonas_sp.AAC.1
MPRVTVLARDRPDSGRSTTFFVNGTQWRNIPNILQIGCRAEAQTTPGGTQVGRCGCPSLPGDHCIQSGMRADAE